MARNRTPGQGTQRPSSEREWKKHLGRKVSLRYRLHGDPSHPFSEAIGLVQSVGAGEDGVVRVTIVNRRGEVTSVVTSDVLAAKVFSA